MVVGELPVCAEGYIGTVRVFCEDEVAFRKGWDDGPDRLQEVFGCLELDRAVGLLIFIRDQTKGPPLLLPGMLDDNTDGVLGRVRMQVGTPV